MNVKKHTPNIATFPNFATNQIPQSNTGTEVIQGNDTSPRVKTTPQVIDTSLTNGTTLMDYNVSTTSSNNNFNPNSLPSSFTNDTQTTRTFILSELFDHNDNTIFPSIQKENFQIKIDLIAATEAEIQKFIIFLKSCNDVGFLKRIVAISLNNITKDNKHEFEKLIDLLVASKCPNLVSFSCKDIQKNAFLFLKEWSHLVSFSCESINSKASVELPDELYNLTSFSCGNISAGAKLTLPNELLNLTFFSCGNIDETTFIFPKIVPKLKSVSFGIIHNVQTRQLLEALKASLLVLTSAELSDCNNTKLQFAQNNDLSIGINLVTDTEVEVQKFIDFLKNSTNTPIFNRLKAISLNAITRENATQIKHLINLLSANCPNLTSFSCEDIRKNAFLSISQKLPNLISFSCGSIDSKATISFSEDSNKLTSFSCGNIFPGATLIFPENMNSLTSFSCGNIDHKAFSLPNELDNLTSFTCGDIKENAVLKFPKELNNLTFFLCKDIYKNATLALPERLPILTSFSCGDIIDDINFSFPQYLPRLKSVSSGMIQDAQKRQLFEGLETWRLTLSPSELCDPSNIKPQFAHNHNLMIEIIFETASKQEANSMIDFLKNPDNIAFLRRFKTIRFNNITEENVLLIQKVLSLLPSKCPNLTSFACKDIQKHTILIFPEELSNLSSFSCGSIYSKAIVSLPDELHNLTFFLCENIHKNVTFSLPNKLPKLKSVTFGEIADNNTQQIFEKLKSECELNNQ